jgi:Xaa-Pro aminopeptidase
MVLTVEPGIYIPPNAVAVDETWRGMGIRIEDNVVVTRKEADVLTSDLCKTVTDIEELMAS